MVAVVFGNLKEVRTINEEQIGDDVILEYFAQLVREVDLFVFGRKTYQLMVPYWPEVAKTPRRQKHRSNLPGRFYTWSDTPKERVVDG